VGCTNQVQNRGVCITHGAKVEKKLCSFEGCTNQVRSGGVCITHGATKRSVKNNAILRDVPTRPGREEFV
jgi:hypothetical protein